METATRQEHQSPAKVVGAEHPPTDDYWYQGIGERETAQYIGLSVRTIQSLRQTGGGPVYIKISSRCVKYRRVDLKAWQDARLVKSTSDTGGLEDEAA